MGRVTGILTIIKNHAGRRLRAFGPFTTKSGWHSGHSWGRWWRGWAANGSSPSPRGAHCSPASASGLVRGSTRSFTNVDRNAGRMQGGMRCASNTSSNRVRSGLFDLFELDHRKMTNIARAYGTNNPLFERRSTSLAYEMLWPLRSLASAPKKSRCLCHRAIRENGIAEITFGKSISR